MCGHIELDLSEPVVMGIINATPDSFSDGGRYHLAGELSIEKAFQRAVDMYHNGAGIIDVGGESTRPGAESVSEQEELDRVVPLIEKISGELNVVVSVDTSSPAVMMAAADAGAGMINDVRALLTKGALEAAATSGLPVCLMHMQGQPLTMQKQVAYRSVVDEVMDFLLLRARAAEGAGIPRQSILLDPGFGFGKTLEHNLKLSRLLPDFVNTQYPILVGYSRKSMIGQITGRDIDQRVAGSLAMAMIALQAGVKILRVHDVAETVDIVRVWMALNAA